MNLIIAAIMLDIKWSILFFSLTFFSPFSCLMMSANGFSSSFLFFTLFRARSVDSFCFPPPLEVEVFEFAASLIALDQLLLPSPPAPVRLRNFLTNLFCKFKPFFHRNSLRVLSHCNPLTFMNILTDFEVSITFISKVITNILRSSLFRVCSVRATISSRGQHVNDIRRKTQNGHYQDT